ncbi:MAG: hypothetical protein HUJ58_06735 [Erysipelotrichaceae bacterium]|nr:hypothetical protein [Erysipelotrichaceae bacterium]
MADRKQEFRDELDDLFAKYVENDDGTPVEHFGRIVTEKMNNASKDKGYDSLSDLITEEVEIGFTGKKTSRPSARVVDLQNIDNRYEYFLAAIENVEYESRYRGNYRIGHQEAISRYADKAELNKTNLMIVDKIIKQELMTFSRETQIKDMYSRGYYDGLKFVEKVLNDSKQQIMKRVYERLRKALG